MSIEIIWNSELEERNEGYKQTIKELHQQIYELKQAAEKNDKVPKTETIQE